MLPEHLQGIKTSSAHKLNAALTHRRSPTCQHMQPLTLADTHVSTRQDCLAHTFDAKLSSPAFQLGINDGYEDATDLNESGSCLHTDSPMHLGDLFNLLGDPMLR